jgi:uncharacterized protein (TIGR03083 family)
LTDDQVTTPSYDDEWSIAQVASHLGSGAEIFGLFLEAGRTGESAPGLERFQPVWDRWNAMAPLEQAREAVTTDAAFLDRVEAMSADDRQRWHLAMFGADQALPGLLAMRLGEHALHTWDIAVALDRGAVVADDAVALLVGTLPALAGRAGKPASTPISVRITTSDPSRIFRLDLTPAGVRLDPAEPTASDDGVARVHLPAEALVRLVYGRLDPQHTPGSVTSDGVELDQLRAAFPGI